MNLENFGEKRVKKPLHHTLLPDNIRMLIVGQFGYGKTNLVVNLTMKYITWSCLYAITNTPSQCIYDVLRAEEDVTFLSPGNISLELFEEILMLMLIFDDFMLEQDQTFPSLIFSQGRHKMVNAIYISQKCTETNLVIRQNANILVMFNIDKKSREGVHSMYASADMDVSDFKKLKLVARDVFEILPMNCRSKKYIRSFSNYIYTVKFWYLE